MDAPSLEIASGFDALHRLAGPPPRDADGADFFCTLAWFETLAREGFTDDAPCPLAVLRPPAPATPVCVPLRVGTVLAGLSNYYTSLYAPVGDAGSVPETLWAALARQLRRVPGYRGQVLLQPLDAAGAFLARLQPALASAGYWTDRFFCFGNWYLLVEGRSFAQYFATLPAALRHTIERGRRKLTRTAPWRIEIQQAADERLDAAIADFEAVYRASWKPAEPQPRFMPALMRLAAAQGWLRLGVLRLGNEPIAAQLWLVKDGKASIYKLAYVERHARLSAGSVLTAALMAHVLDEDHVAEVDYLTGDDDYKRDWMSQRRERVGLVAFHPHTWHGLRGAARHFMGKQLRQWKLT